MWVKDIDTSLHQSCRLIFPLRKELLGLYLSLFHHLFHGSEKKEKYRRKEQPCSTARAIVPMMPTVPPP